MLATFPRELRVPSLASEVPGMGERVHSARIGQNGRKAKAKRRRPFRAVLARGVCTSQSLPHSYQRSTWLLDLDLQRTRSTIAVLREQISGTGCAHSSTQVRFALEVEGWSAEKLAPRDFLPFALLARGGDDSAWFTP